MMMIDSSDDDDDDDGGDDDDDDDDEEEDEGIKHAESHHDKHTRNPEKHPPRVIAVGKVKG